MVEISKLLVYGMYWFCIETKTLMYLYLTKVFEGYDGTDNAIYTIYLRIIGMFGLLVVIPIVSGKLQMHEGLVLTAINYTVAIGAILSAYAVTLWQFYIGQGLTFLWISQYSVAR